MRIRASATVWLSLWLGLLALAASAFEQRQLTLTTLSAMGISSPSAFAVPRGYHMMPDGTFMAGVMHGAAPARPCGEDENAPNSNDACMAIAAMAGFVMPGLPQLAALPALSEGDVTVRVTTPARTYTHPAYASRAPPRA